MEYQIGDYVKTKKPTATMESGTYGVVRNVNNAGLTIDYIGHGVNGVPHDDARWFLEKVEPLEYLQHGMDTVTKDLHRLTLTLERLQGECRRIIFDTKEKENPHENFR